MVQTIIDRIRVLSDSDSRQVGQLGIILGSELGQEVEAGTIAVDRVGVNGSTKYVLSMGENAVEIPVSYFEIHLSGYEHRMNGYVAMTQRKEHVEFVGIFSQS